MRYACPRADCKGSIVPDENVGGDFEPRCNLCGRSPLPPRPHEQPHVFKRGPRYSVRKQSDPKYVYDEVGERL